MDQAGLTYATEHLVGSRGGDGVKWMTPAEGVLLLILATDLLNLDVPFQLSIIEGINSIYFVLPMAFLVLGHLKLATGLIHISRRAMTMSYSLFVGYVLLNSVLVSIRPDISMRYAALFLMWYLGYVFFLQFRFLRIDRVIYGYVAILTVYFLASIVANVALLQPRLVGITMEGDASRMGFLAFFGLTAAQYLARIGYFRYQMTRWVILGILAIGLVYAGSRTVYLMMALVFPLALLGNRVYRARDVVLLGFLSIAVLCALYILGVVTGSDAIGNQMEKLIGSVIGGSDIYKGRSIFFEFAKMIIKDNPGIIIFGIGLESYLTYETDLESALGRVNVLHNMFLQYSLGLGVVGVTIFVSYLYCLASAIGRIANKYRRDFLYLILMGSLVYGLFHPNIVSRSLLFLLPLICGVSARQTWHSARTTRPLRTGPVSA